MNVRSCWLVSRRDPSALQLRPCTRRLTESGELNLSPNIGSENSTVTKGPFVRPPKGIEFWALSAREVMVKSWPGLRWRLIPSRSCVVIVSTYAHTHIHIYIHIYIGKSNRCAHYSRSTRWERKRQQRRTPASPCRSSTETR